MAKAEQMPIRLSVAKNLFVFHDSLGMGVIENGGKTIYSKNVVLFIYIANTKIAVDPHTRPIASAITMSCSKYKYNFAGTPVVINPKI